MRDAWPVKTMDNNFSQQVKDDSCCMNLGSPDYFVLYKRRDKVSRHLKWWTRIASCYVLKQEVGLVNPWPFVFSHKQKVTQNA